MKAFTFLLGLLIFGVSAGSAEEPRPLFDGSRWIWPNLHEQWQKRSCWCPDDYRRKSLPLVSPNAKGCVDDYCRKPLPGVAPNAKGSVDDYCPKKCPLFLGSLFEPWYRCVPACNKDVPRQLTPTQP